MQFNNIVTTYYVCFFFCMKEKQKIKLLNHLKEKWGNQRLQEATFWWDKVGAADGTLMPELNKMYPAMFKI